MAYDLRPFEGYNRVIECQCQEVIARNLASVDKVCPQLSVSEYFLDLFLRQPSINSEVISSLASFTKNP